jgi:hypothetical protein
VVSDEAITGDPRRHPALEQFYLVFRLVIARSESDDVSAEAQRAKAEAIRIISPEAVLDCFAEPVIGRAFARPVGSQ